MKRRVALAAGIAILIAIPAVGAAGGEEQVVEGHTVYEKIVAERAPVISVIGDVRCHVEVLRVRVAVPPSVGSAGANCDAGVQVFGSGVGAPDPRKESLSPTGRTFTAQGPQGHQWTTTEYTYQALGQTWRAYGLETGPTRVHPGTGQPYDFVAAFPGDVAGGERVKLRAAGG